MKLSKEKTTEEVKETFHKQYPMLKLEFYNKEHLAFAGSKEKYKVTEEVGLGELNAAMKDGTVDINDDLKVEELESIFEEKFGLHVQVYRKSGDQWMQTSITDNWTLGKQELKGEEQDKFKHSS
jgi:hypothetical protein